MGRVGISLGPNADPTWTQCRLNSKTKGSAFRYQHVGIGNTKRWRRIKEKDARDISA